MKTAYDTSSYMNGRLEPDKRSIQIKRAVKALRKYKNEYDTIAFRGMSGALYAPELATRLKKHLIIVRKNTKDCHSGHIVEGHQTCQNYIIVDDFINTGHTVWKIRQAVKEFAPDAKCIGVLQIDELTSDRVAKNKKLSKVAEKVPKGWNYVY